jgi:hypothetical protein
VAEDRGPNLSGDWDWIRLDGFQVIKRLSFFFFFFHFLGLFLCRKNFLFVLIFQGGSLMAECRRGIKMKPSELLSVQRKYAGS